MLSSTDRLNVFSGSPWEDKVGYARAVRLGNLIHVSGTTAVDENGNVVGVGDAGAQARFVFQLIDTALRGCDAALRDVVRTRMFVTDIDQWEAIGKAHREIFGDIRPAATMVEVTRLIHPELLIEIEAEALLSG
ncbi:MAG: RidA family protein [Alphaproteobacteria bacterium]